MGTICALFTSKGSEYLTIIKEKSVNYFDCIFDSYREVGCRYKCCVLFGMEEDAYVK